MLYHVNTGIPGFVVAQTHGLYKLEYGEHARRAAREDRYGPLTHHLPPSLHSREATLIEVETKNNFVVKCVWRLPLDEKKDIVLAVNMNGFVRTVWANLVSDTHSTLDKRRYA